MINHQQCHFVVATSTSPDHKALGLLAYSSQRAHPEIIPPVEEPELYIRFLIASRDDPRVKGVGRAFVAECELEAAEGGAEVIRVDCFDGEEAKGALVRVYEGMGFVKMGGRIAYNEEGWMGQVLGKRVGARDGGKAKGSG